MPRQYSEAHAAMRARIQQRLRDHRVDAGLTQKQAGAGATTTETVWKLWESGRRSPSPTSLGKAARALDIPLESLLCDDGYVPLATFVLSPDSVTRLTSPSTRERALEEIHAALSAQLRLEIEKARPLAPATSGRAKRRRTREETLLLQASRLQALKERPRQAPRSVE